MANESLIMSPSGFKATKLYSMFPNDDTGSFTVSRNSEAARTNKEGFLEFVGVNVPRVHYPTIGGCPVVLTEEESTNILTFSNAFEDVSWVESVSSISQVEDNIAVGLDGNLTASRIDFIVEANANTGLIKTSPVDSSTDYVGGICVKGEGSDIGKTIKLRIKRAAGISAEVTVEITLTNDWVRTSVPIFFESDNVSSFFIISSNDAGSCLIDHSQLEKGVVHTSRIRTSGSAETRLKDQIAFAGDVDLFNSAEGCLFIETKALSNTSTDRIYSLSDGTTSNRIYIFFDTNNTLRFFIVTGGVFQFAVTASGIDILNKNKIAIAWDEDEVLVYVNGTETNTILNITPPIGLSDLSFSHPNGSANVFASETSETKVFSVKPTLSELVKLTT